MKSAFEGAVSALCYSFIRAHFGTRAGAPGPAWNRTVGFILAQHARMATGRGRQGAGWQEGFRL